MRKRLFWAIAGVAFLTGVLVLAGVIVASQRAAVEATQRELSRSADEVVSILQDTVEASNQRPGALVELIRVLEGDPVGSLLGRIRRTAGSSDLAFAAIGADGVIRSNDPLFTRFSIDQDAVAAGEKQFVKSTSNELVVVAPTVLTFVTGDATVLVAVAREAPVVRSSDMFRELLLVAIGMVAISALLARVLSTQLTRRLRPFSDAALQLASGDLTTRVPDLDDPDLDEVAEAFNDMAGELEDTRQREREFLLGVGHDLRTPLTTIAGYAEALESGAVDRNEMTKIGAVLGTQSRQLGRLIEDLSLLARLEQPEFGLRSEEVDAGAHVTEIVDGFQRRAADVGVKLEVDAVGAPTLITDPDRLGQIAQNLVENALRFTPEAGSVTVAVKGDGDGVVLSVSDTGTGIDPDDLPHVFDRHYTGRQRRVRNEGSGLGLSIVKGLAERLGGTVTAESRPGHGTTITVRLASLRDGEADPV
ncbi:MAG: HAMP domain-containing sensor histidine kinase [Acidimicrobiia bacterium]